MLTHRAVCPQQKSLLINGAEGGFSTGLLNAFSTSSRKIIEIAARSRQGESGRGREISVQLQNLRLCEAFFVGRPVPTGTPFAWLRASAAMKFRAKKSRSRRSGPWPCLVVDYLPMQKLEKIRPSRSSELNAPVISPKACCAWRRSSANSSPAPASVSWARPCSRCSLA